MTLVSYLASVDDPKQLRSARSHKRYQELIGEWHARRHQLQEQKQLSEDEKIVASITAASLRRKRRQGLPVSVYELGSIESSAKLA